MNGRGRNAVADEPVHWKMQRAPRQRIHKSGVIAFNDRHCTIPCTIRKFSASAACLSVSNTSSIPDKFELIIEIDGIEADCEVIWRNGDDIGIRFSGSVKTTTPQKNQAINPVVPERSKPLGRQPVHGPENDTGDNQTFSTHKADLTHADSDKSCASKLSDIGFQYDDLLALVVTLHPEVSRACILIGISACVANAIATNAPDVKPRALITYFPRESAKLIMASHTIGRWYGTSEHYKLLNNFNTKLSLAKESTLGLAAKGLAWGACDLDELQDLAQSWQEASAAGRALLLGLDEMLVNHGIGGSRQELAPLVQLLERVVRGEHPVIGSNGQVLMPSWAERRKFERTPVSASGLLSISGHRLQVVVRDVSATGLGLECGDDLPLEAEVELQIEGAPRFIGKVAWSSNGRAGIQLRHPMHRPDPRLTFCSANEFFKD